MKFPLKPSSTADRHRFDCLWGLLFSTFCGAALVAQLLRYSHLKPLWLDEMYSFYQVDGKSISQMLVSLRTGINLLPPLYFIGLSIALHFFKFSPLLGRALSCGFIVATVPVLWSVLRRNVGPAITTMAIASVLFGSQQIFYHNSEARPYGLYLFCAALVLWGFARAGEAKQPSGWTLGLIALANALLPSANYFGGLYSAVSLAVLLLFDWRSGRPRLRIYAAYALGWAAFSLFVLPLCVAQYKARGAAGTGWLPAPPEAFRYLLTEYRCSLSIGAGFCLTFLALLFFAGRKNPKKNLSAETRDPTDAPPLEIAVLGLAWLALPLIFVLQASVTGKNFYSGRYFIASDLGAMLLVAVTLSSICQFFGNARTLEEIDLSKTIHYSYRLFIAISTLFVAQRFCRNYHVNIYEGAVAVEKARIWQTIPQATFSIEFYTESLFHAPPKTRLYLLTQSVNERENINRFHPDFRAIDPETLSTQREFLFVDSYLTPKSFQVGSWAATHGFSAQKLGDYTQFVLPWDYTLLRAQTINVATSLE